MSVATWWCHSHQGCQDDCRDHQACALWNTHALWKVQCLVTMALPPSLLAAAPTVCTASAACAVVWTSARSSQQTSVFLPQAQGLGGVALKYTGMWDVLSKTVRHEGFFGLYKASLECRHLQLPPLDCVPLACSSGLCATHRHGATPCRVQKPYKTRLSHAIIRYSVNTIQGVLPNLFKLAPAAGISWFTFEVRCTLRLLTAVGHVLLHPRCDLLGRCINPADIRGRLWWLEGFRTEEHLRCAGGEASVGS